MIHLVNNKNTFRIFGLDLVRAIAILLVVIHHGFLIFPFPFIPLPDGVDIFFVLSGFLIGRILIKSLVQKGTFTSSDLKLFLIRRWFRTLPALWFALLLNFSITFILTLQNSSIKGAIKQMFIRDKLWQYLFFVQNLYSNLNTGFFGESWSLSVEEWFYLFLPISLFILLKIKIKPRHAILFTILILIIGSSWARYCLSDIHTRGTFMLTRMIVIMRLDSIAFGVLLGYINYYKPTLWARLTQSKLLFISGIAFFYLSFLIVNRGLLLFNSITLTNLLFYPICSFFLMGTIPMLSIKAIKKTSLRIVTFISKISYSMYLVNLSIVIQLIDIFSPSRTTKAEEIIYYIIYWIVTIGIATCMYTFIEQPFIKLRDKYFNDTHEDTSPESIQQQNLLL